MEEEKRDLKPEVVFVHNTARSVSTRVQRATAGVRRKNQALGGGELRLIRNRPTELHKELFFRHLNELRQLAKEGRVEVRTRDGRLIDLLTMEVGPAPVVPPLPNPPLDSIKNDRIPGAALPQFPGGLVPDLSEESTGIPSSLDAQRAEGEDAQVSSEEEVGLESTSTSGDKSSKKGRRR